MSDRKRVLVTGMSGRIGRIMREHLGNRYELFGVDRVPVAGVNHHVVADISNFGAIRQAFDGVDAVVHLAADPRVEGSWESNLANNLAGAYNVFEAARQAGAKRIVFASSQHATGGFYLESPYKDIMEGRFDKVKRPFPLITMESPIRPDSLYGASKAYGEALGRYYSDFLGLSVICLRIGWVMDEDDPVHARSPMSLSFWLSHRDAAQVIQKSLDAPDSLRYATVYAMSGNNWCFWDLEPARKLLDYRPQDNAGDVWKGPSRQGPPQVLPPAAPT